MSFIIATANNIESIPPEFMRAGRFDEIFFLDLPSKEERSDIAAKLLNRKKRNPENYDLDAIANVCENYVGAEIEKAIDNALFVCYYEDKRELKTQDIVDAFKTFVPLYTSRKAEIESMRQWAKDGGAIFANSSVKPKTKTLKPKKKRKEAPLDFGNEIDEEIEI